MGFFAFYNGWIYNEFFAIPLDIFGSCYEDEVKVLANQPGPKVNGLETWDPKEYGYKRTKIGDSFCVYPFGFDPVWVESDNFLSYTNNFKMKLAVILAIL